MRTLDIYLDTGGRLGARTAEIGVGVEMQVEVRNTVPHPSCLPVAQRAFDVTHELIQSHVVLRRPFRDVPGQVCDGSQYIEACQPGCVEDLH